jgi:hypothetical protein
MHVEEHNMTSENRVRFEWEAEWFAASWHMVKKDILYYSWYLDCTCDKQYRKASVLTLGDQM